MLLPKAGRTVARVLAPEVNREEPNAVLSRATNALSQGRQVAIQPQEFPELYCLVTGFYKPKKVWTGRELESSWMPQADLHPISTLSASSGFPGPGGFISAQRRAAMPHG